MRRDGAAVVMIALGVLGLRLGLTDAMLDYVKPFMRWPIVASAVLLLLLGNWELYLAFRDRERGHSPADDTPTNPHLEELAHVQGQHDHDHAGHSHGSGGPTVTWLLLLPVVVTLVIAPGALQADAVRRALPASLIPVEELAPLPAPVDGAYTLPMAEFAARSVGPEGDMEGIDVRLNGFTVRRGTETWLARFSLTCCAADARVYEAMLVGLDDPFPDNTWLEVIGQWQPTPPGEEHQAMVLVGQAMAIDRPANPYE